MQSLKDLIYVGLVSEKRAHVTSSPTLWMQYPVNSRKAVCCDLVSCSQQSLRVLIWSNMTLLWKYNAHFVYLSDIPVVLKPRQDTKKWYRLVEIDRGYTIMQRLKDLAETERPCWNGVQENQRLTSRVSSKQKCVTIITFHEESQVNKCIMCSIFNKHITAWCRCDPGVWWRSLKVV